MISVLVKLHVQIIVYQITVINQKLVINVIMDMVLSITNVKHVT